MYKHLIEFHEYYIAVALITFRDDNRNNYLVDDTTSLRVMFFNDHEEYDFGDEKTEFYTYRDVRVEYSTHVEINRNHIVSTKPRNRVELVYYYDHKIDMHAKINGVDFAVSTKYRFDSDEGYQLNVEPRITKTIRHFVDLCLKFEEDYKQRACTHSYNTTNGTWIEN